MCLLAFAFGVHPAYDLVVVGNRDELHTRPSAALDWWSDTPELIGGRDLQAGGTWLGMHRNGRFAAVTNFREDLPRPRDAPSRGDLVANFLAGRLAPQAYLQQLQHSARRYAGFNLLLADARQLWYASNRNPPFSRQLAPGIYGLSNELLDTPWPKLVRARAGLAAWVDRGAVAPGELFELLADRTPATWGPPQADGEMTRLASAAFIVHERYGTRCSTVLTRATGGQFTLSERRFGPAGRPAGASSLVVSMVTEPVGSAEL